VDWVEDSDLRYVSQQATFLKAVVDAYKLKSGEGVLYSNRAFNRFRLVVMVNRMPLLIVPPVAKGYDLLISLFLQISIFLRETFGSKRKVGNRLDEAVNQAHARVTYRKKHLKKRKNKSTRR